MSRLALLLVIVLAGCGTPQERCQRGLQGEVRQLDQLIAETETNIARGFRYETEVRDVSFGFSYCSRSRNVGVCFDNRSPRTVRRAVAIDPQSERRKLAGLTERRADLAARTCRADGAVILSGPAR